MILKLAQPFSSFDILMMIIRNEYQINILEWLLEDHIRGRPILDFTDTDS